MQNAPPPLGSSLPVDTVRAVVSRVPRSATSRRRMCHAGSGSAACLQDAPPSLLGVMGGAGGRFVLDEYARGACGSMPACELVEVHVSIWRAVKAGDNRRARDLFTRILPLLNMGGVFRQEVVKRVLKHRGLIASARLRDNSTPLDRYDEAEIQAIIADLGDLMTVQPATPADGSAMTRTRRYEDLRSARWYATQTRMGPHSPAANLAGGVLPAGLCRQACHRDLQHVERAEPLPHPFPREGGGL
jgi:4-hydroxy-tetrahydrodipicolinate synthase